MKIKFRTMFLSILVIGISITFSASCKKAALGLTTTCVNNTGCSGKTFKTCSTAGGGGYYEYNGVKYSWTGLDASAAFASLSTAMGCK